MQSFSFLRRGFALALVGVLGALAPACSQQSCSDMKSSGSFFSFFCGGEGDLAPEAIDGGPNACSDIKQVMPEFFALLEANQLSGIKQAVENIGAPSCADPLNQRHCTEDTVCTLGYCDTTSNLCPCQHFYNPLGDLLETTFTGIAAIASPSKPAEPGAISPSKCVDAAAAQQLYLSNPSSLNPLCEVRRTLDFLVNQNGGAKLFKDPAITAVLVALLNYIQGNYTPPSGQTATPHYDLFTTFGLIAQDSAACSPANTYDLLDKALIYLTPVRGTRLANDLTALLNDPTTVHLLSSLGGTSSDPAARRAAVVTLLIHLLPSIQAARDGAAALSPIQTILVSPLLNLYGPGSSYSQQFQNEVRTVLIDLGCAQDPTPNHAGDCIAPNDPVMGSGLLGTDAGLFPDIADPQMGLLHCLNDADPMGNLLGALYDLITLQSTAAGGSINLATLLGALQELLALDPTGQTNRTLRLVIEGIAADPTAVDALSQLLAKTLTPTVGAELIPPLSQLIQHQVVGEILGLLQDILYSCSPPSNGDAGSN
jgi:hypothetical protein